MIISKVSKFGTTEIYLLTITNSYLKAGDKYVVLTMQNKDGFYFIY